MFHRTGTRDLYYKVFVTASHFPPNIIYEDKAMNKPLEWGSVDDSTWVGSGLGHKHLTRVEVSYSDNTLAYHNAGLIQGTDTRGLCYKAFVTDSYFHPNLIYEDKARNKPLE
jgi:hypothetical protein